MSLVLFGLRHSAESASAPHLVISEIQITGETGFSTDEFVELYNPTNDPIVLNGFKLTKKTAAGSEYDLLTAFPERTVAPGGYFLITHPTGYRGAVSADALFDTTNSLASNNATLLYDASGTVIDMVGFGSSMTYETAAIPNPSANKSIERKAVSSSVDQDMIEGGADYFRGNGEDTDTNAADFIIRDSVEPQNSSSEPEFVSTAPTVPVIQPVPATTDIPTIPTATNTSVTPIPTPQPTNPQPQTLAPDITDGVILNEVYPAPKASEFTEEYIELMNTTTRTVRLDGWRLTDMKKKFVVPAGSSIGAGDVLKFSFGQTKITLNNTGDTVFLQDPNGKVIQGVEYGKAPNDQSFSFSPTAGWKWTEPTPGGENVFDEPVAVAGEVQENPAKDQEVEEPVLVTIAEAKTRARGTQIRITATVTAEPGILGTGILYIEDGTGGIPVAVTGSAPDLAEGDSVSLQGTVGQSAGYPKINVKEAALITVEGQGEALLLNIELSEVAVHLHRLVRITGTVQSVERTTAIIENDQGDTAIVYFKRTANIAKPDWREGDHVTVIGIVEAVSGETRVLPRRDEDISRGEVLGETTVVEEETVMEEEIEIDEAKSSKTVLFTITGVVVILGAAGWAWSKRNTAKSKMQSSKL